MYDGEDGMRGCRAIVRLYGTRREGDHRHSRDGASFHGGLKEVRKGRADDGNQLAHVDDGFVTIVGNRVGASDEKSCLDHCVIGENQLHQLLLLLLPAVFAFGFGLSGELLLDSRAEHINATANSARSTRYLRNLGTASPFGVQRSKARTKHTHRREMAMNRLEPLLGPHVAAVQRKRQRDDVHAQLLVSQAHLVLQKSSQRLVGELCPQRPRRSLLVLVVLVREDELEEFHQLALGAGRERSRGEDVFAGGGDAREHGCRGRIGGGRRRRRRLANEEGADGQEFELAEGAGRDELGQEPGARVDELRAEGERVGAWEGERRRGLVIFGGR